MKNITRYILYALLFLFPLFFLPITQEFYLTNKLYLLAAAALLLIVVATVEALLTRKVSWRRGSFDSGLVLLLVAVLLSVVLSSPNKVEAILNPTFGLLSFFSLTVLYFFLSQDKKNFSSYQMVLMTSSLVLSLLTIIMFFQPLKNVNFPASWQFLKNPLFTPLGTQLDLAVFLGLFVVWTVFSLAQHLKKETAKSSPSILNTLYFILPFIALLLTLYTLFKPATANETLRFLLPPYRLSWYAAVEGLKNPLSALFGVGVDNYSSVFAQVKDLLYNQSPLWQVSSFNVGRSALLHLFSTVGAFGLLAFAILVFMLFKRRRPQVIAPVSYVLLAWLFLPASLTSLFLFFFIITLVSSQEEVVDEQSFDIPPALIPVGLGVGVVVLAFVGFSTYFLGRAYAAEYFFKKSLDGLVARNAAELYNNQRQTVILNPRIERFRTNFSQTNLLIANNIIFQASQAQQKKGGQGQQTQLSEQQRQTVTQAIQAAIAEAKAAVVLNPQKATSWENLAVIYRNILNLAQQADVWTISSYQRAVVLDPQNPIYRLNLGGVYYQLQNFDEAGNLFRQAVSLKPDWANAHYNLAWANYQKENFQVAATEMQAVLTLLQNQNQTGSNDYKKAQKEFEEFKKKIPTEPTKTTPPGQLQLPQPPQPQLSPKLELPKTASPEAR